MKAAPKYRSWLIVAISLLMVCIFCPHADAQMAPWVQPAGVRAFLLQNLVKRPKGWTWRANLAALEGAQGMITGFPGSRASFGASAGTSFNAGIG